MSSLLIQQTLFAKMVPRLIDKAYEMGYLVTFGDAFRSPLCAYGASNSKHKIRLAIDLNLFTQDGVYLEDTEDHKLLGEWWESQGGIWGGRFKQKDGNHYQAPDDKWVPHLNGIPLQLDVHSV